MNNLSKSLALVLVNFVLIGSVGFAGNQVLEVDEKQSAVGFLVIGDPGFLRINGENGVLSGKATLHEEANQKAKLSAELTANLAPLKTGISLRDEHMHEKYLETKKFPTATLKVEPLTITPSGNQEIEFSGTLTIKGVSKEVKGTAKIQFSADGKSATGEALVKTNLNDFPIGAPSYLGVSVAEELEVTAKFVAKAAL